MSISSKTKSMVKTLASRCTPLYRPAPVGPMTYSSVPLTYNGTGYLHKGILRRLELALYYLIVGPITAFLPARLAYGVACLRAEVLYHLDRPKRRRILRSLQVVLGDQLSQAELRRVAREHLRVRSCELVDVLRLAGKGQALARLVEIRGLEHIEAALAAGKGAILCGGHFGSYDSCFSLLGLQSLPITVIGRWPSKSDGDRSALERFIFRHLYQRPVARHRHRPNIEPRAGQMGTAVQAAKILHQNEVVGILLDPPVLAADHERAVPVKFLNGQVWLLPGVVTLAQLTGAPVLMAFMYRTADWQHQVLEISPPVPVEGDPATAFERCMAPVAEAIRQRPAHWRFWNLSVLVDLRLLPPDAM